MTTTIDMKRRTRPWTVFERPDRIAWLLGFSLPLSGGVSLSRWIPAYPDQLTIVRLVSAFALFHTLNQGPATTSRRSNLLGERILGAVCFYACLSLAWTPDKQAGIDALTETLTAMTTGIAVYIVAVIRQNGLIWITKGILASFVLQVAVSLVEIETGQHLSASFASTYVEQYRLQSVEDVLGNVAWGTLGNPNDLAGYLLLSLAVLATAGAYGIHHGRYGRLIFTPIALAGVYIGLTALADARGFRFGLLAAIAIVVGDRILPTVPSLRAAVAFTAMSTLAVTYIISVDSGVLQTLLGLTGSDTQRTDLVRIGLQGAIDTFGIGLGIGAEAHLLKAGTIPTNFHNVFARTGAELGIVVAALLCIFLVRPLKSWLFVGRELAETERATNVARATLSIALIIYGSVASGALAAPHFWAFAALIAVQNRRLADLERFPR